MIVLALVLRRCQRWDERHSGVPGERWAAFGSGLALLQTARSGHPPWMRAAAGIAGVVMMWRAAGGRDGFLRQLRESDKSTDDDALRLFSEDGAVSAAPPSRYPISTPAVPPRRTRDQGQPPRHSAMKKRTISADASGPVPSVKEPLV
jgi:hypothetical protein